MQIAIIGAGLSGAVANYFLQLKGHTVTVFEKRIHAGGNCYDTRDMNNILVHKYGPHAFHTNNKKVWEFVNSVVKFIPFKLKVSARIQDGRIINIPYNNLTKSLVGEWDSNHIKKEIFIPYSEKQWGIKWSNIPKSITSRVPIIRNDYSLDYHLDTYQGLPEKGYTDFINKLFYDANICFGCKNKEWEQYNYDLIIYTGSIDEYYDYKYGSLPYRSLNIQEFIVEKTKFNQLNECNTLYKNTRTVDHSYWEDSNSKFTTITKEFPEPFNKTNERFYPIRSKENILLYNKYKNITNKKVIFIGRLGEYIYMDMDSCILNSINKIKNI